MKQILYNYVHMLFTVQDFTSKNTTTLKKRCYNVVLYQQRRQTKKFCTFKGILWISGIFGNQKGPNLTLQVQSEAFSRAFRLRCALPFPV